MNRITSVLPLRAGLLAALTAVAAADVRIEASAVVTSQGPLNGQLTHVSLRCADTGVPGTTPSSSVHAVLPNGSWFSIGTQVFSIEPTSSVNVSLTSSSATLDVQCNLVGGGSMHLILVDTMAPLFFASNSLGQLHGTYHVNQTATHAHGFNNLPSGAWGFMLGSLAEVSISDYGQDPGATYCVGAQNSTGVAALLRLNGSAVAAANSLRIDATRLPSQVFGFFLVSRTQGFLANPGGSQGNLCLGGAIGRFVGPGQVQNSGAAGAFSLNLDLAQMPSPSGFVAASAGQTWNFQSWFRDTSGGSAVSNYTSAVSVLFE